jgi:hypothetical protein
MILFITIHFQQVSNIPLSLPHQFIIPTYRNFDLYRRVERLGSEKL